MQGYMLHWTLPKDFLQTIMTYFIEETKCNDMQRPQNYQPIHTCIQNCSKGLVTEFSSEQKQMTAYGNSNMVSEGERTQEFPAHLPVLPQPPLSIRLSPPGLTTVVLFILVSLPLARTA